MSVMRQARAPFPAACLCLFLACGISFSSWNCVRADSYFDAIAPSAEQPIVIPFEYAHGHIFLQLALDGSGMRTIMLDTGFTSDKKLIMIDASVADQLRMGHGEPLEIAGLGTDNIHGRKIDDIDVHLGKTQVIHSSAESFNFAFLRTALHHPLDGIIGFAFLRDYVAEIDYPDRVLRLYDPAHYRYRGYGIEVAMDEARPAIRAVVLLPNGQEREAQLLIDTGSDAVLLLDPHFVRPNARLPRGANIQQSSYIGLSGRYICDVIQLSKIQLGNNLVGPQMWVQSFYAELAPIRVGVSAGSQLDGDVGNTLLERMSVIFDSARARVIFEVAPVKIAMK